MIITLISWIYIFFVSLILGLAVNKILSKMIPVPSIEEIGVTGMCVTGLVSLTVYAEYFSIFYKVNALCHGIMFVAFVLCLFLLKKELLNILSSIFQWDNRVKIIIFIILCIIASFYSSRGKYHTDTGIYHAQAIRLIEEYGCIKGLGNFQLHFAYNSSYLALCALFTMSFILPEALHTMTGFFMVLFSSYAINGLFQVRKHKKHGSDMARIAVLIYSFTIMTGLQSPATDYGAMYMALYILTAWLINAEEKKSSAYDIAVYGYLSVLAIFTVSVKLSTATIVLLAIVPLALLIRKKKYKEIAYFVLIGFLSFLPYIIRNVILSGYLFYPVDSIDLFNVIWKIPAEYLKNDTAQITVWGRCLNDVNRLNDPLSVWLPIWWSKQQIYGKMLLGSQFIGLVLVTMLFLRKIDKDYIIKNDILVFYTTVISGIAMWFMTAPFIRYGLAFMLLLPLCAIGDYFSEIFHKGWIRFLTIALGALFLFGSWLINYADDNIEFINDYGTDGYVLWLIPYEDVPTDAYEMNGVTVYNSTEEEVCSYYYCPNSCYNEMINRTELIGDTIKEGFKPKMNYLEANS